MSKRNFVLLIIVLLILSLGVFGYLYFYQSKEQGDSGTVRNFLSRFVPFGNSAPKGDDNSSNEPEPGDTETPDGEVPEIPELKLKKVSSIPVAGYGIFRKERYKEVVVPPVSEQGVVEEKSTTTSKPVPPETEFVTALRYVDRVNGNIYQTFADKIDERKFSSTVIPKVYEAYFGDKAESVVMRYLKIDDETIETFVGKIPKEILGADTSTPNEVKGTFLPPDVTAVSLSPDNLKLFYLLEIGESVVGTTYGLNDDKKVQIFDSTFTEWEPWWGGSKAIALTTKPSAFIPGHVYVVNSDTKKLERVLGGINGLTTLLGPDGKTILYSGSDLSLSLYNIETQSSTPVSLRTLPEKCVWNKGNTVVYCAVPKELNSISYPDIWYRGEVSFRDQIWKIDVETGTTEIILNPSVVEGGEEVDAIKLGLDEDEKYLFFVNKKDSYLWKFELN